MAYDDEWVLTYQDEWVLTYQAVQTLHAAVTVLRLSRLGAVLHADAAAGELLAVQIAALEEQIGPLEWLLAARRTRPLRARPARRGLPVTSPDDLSRQQRAILALLAEGKHDKEIAAALSLALQTVKNHCAVLYRRLPIPASTNHRRAAAAWYRHHQHDD